MGDIKVVRVIHTSHSVVVRMRMARIGWSQALFPVVQMRTPSSHFTAFTGSAIGDDSDVIVFPTDGDAFLDCPDAAFQMRRTKRAVQFSFPRTCLGNPDWVRGRGITVVDVDAAEPNVVEYIDVAPGRRTKLKHALSTRAYAPDRSQVADTAPTTTAGSASHWAMTRLRALALLG